MRGRRGLSVPSWRWLVVALVYALLVVGVVYAVDLNRFANALGHLGIASIVLVLVLAVAHIFGRALRYHHLVVLAKPTGDYHGLHGLRVFLAGLCSAIVTPARIGDLVKARLLERFGIKVVPAANLVVIERILDLASVVLLLLLAVPFLPVGVAAPWLGVGLVGAFLLLGGGACFTSARLRSRLEVLLLRVIRGLHSGALNERAADAVSVVFNGLAAVFASPRRALLFLGGSVLAWGIEFTKLAVLLHLLGATVSPAVVCFAYPASILASLVVLLPVSEGVVGTTVVGLLVSVGGVDPTLAVAATLLDRAASSLTPFPLWITLSMLLRTRHEFAPATPEGL